MTISGLTKGRVFGESQIAKSDVSPAPGRTEPRPIKAGFVFLGFSISWPSRKSLRLQGIPRPVPAPVNQRSEAVTKPTLGSATIMP